MLTPPPIRIRNVTIDPPFVLAPMSGVTCSAFRRLIKTLNPGSVGLVVTEFLSVEGLTRGGKRTLEMMRFREDERPIGVQIFGVDSGRMRDAAIMVQDAGAEIVDVNAGCPAPKVVRRGGGVDLMRKPDVIAAILKEIRRSVSIPLTLKIRSGWDNDSLNALEIARIAAGEGVDLLTVHGRTRKQMYSGEADWDLVQRIAEELPIPVCGSGDITSRNAMCSRMKGKIAGLYIGRAALSNPRVFSDLREGVHHDIRSNPLEAIAILRQYIDLLKEDMPDRASIGKVKQLICRMIPRQWWWKPVILRKLTLEDIIEVLEEAAEKSPSIETNGEAGALPRASLREAEPD